jgi:hypothetical protein
MAWETQAVLLIFSPKYVDFDPFSLGVARWLCFSRHNVDFLVGGTGSGQKRLLPRLSHFIEKSDAFPEFPLSRPLLKAHE